MSAVLEYRPADGVADPFVLNQLEFFAEDEFGTIWIAVILSAVLVARPAVRAGFFVCVEEGTFVAAEAQDEGL